MSKKANPVVIGTFIVSAIVLIVATVLIVSSDAFFNKNIHYVTVFPESINGLNIGAPIKLNGVQIGQVTNISVARDVRRNEILVAVEIEIDPNKIADYESASIQQFNHATIDEMIDAGLRMQLQLSSLLTGQLFIEARFLPNTEKILYGAVPGGLQEIPSVSSSSAEIQKTLRTLLKSAKGLSIGELFENINKTVLNIEKITGSEQTLDTLASLNGSMSDLQQFMKILKTEGGSIGLDIQKTVKDAGKFVNDADKFILALAAKTEPISRDLQKTIKDADELLLMLNSNAGQVLVDSREMINIAKTTLEAMTASLANIESLTNSDSALSQDLRNALQELARATRSARVMMDYLEQHPDAIIYGKGSGEEGRK